MRDGESSVGPVGAALRAVRDGAGAGGWGELPFFRDGSGAAVAAEVDGRIAGGAQVLPSPDRVFAALALTPLPCVRAVILGQDPYPTPGDAQGLAFSCHGRRLPPSLRAIVAELASDLGGPPPTGGDLTPWARQGVLLLNSALTVEAGRAGSHLKLGWSALTDQAVAAVSARRPAVAFLLWGAAARQRAALIDAGRHAVIEAGHPSPLNRLNDFRGSRPFSRANAFLASRGQGAIDWRLP